MLPKKRMKRFNRRRRYWVWYLQNRGRAGTKYTTLGSIGGATRNTLYTSRAAYPEFVGIIAVTSGNGQLEKNDSGTWGVAVDMTAEGDFYKCRATSGLDFGDVVTITVDLPDTFTITNAQKDETPNPFHFQDQFDAEPFTETTSLPVTITGMDEDCPVSILFGQYDVNQNDVWTSAPGTINPGDLIRVRRTSGGFSTVESVTFHAGNTQDTFSVFTRAAQTAPDPFDIVDQTDVAQDTAITSAVVSPTGLEVNATITVIGGLYQLNGAGGFVSTPGTFSPGDTFEAQVQSSPAYATETECAIDIAGVSSMFKVVTIPQPGMDYLYDSDGNIMIDSDGNPVLAP